MRASRPAAIGAGRPWVLENLHPLPVIAVRLMRLVSTDDVIFRRVADLIQADAAFSAEVLRLANSPLLGCREVHGILHAMAILGLDRLKGLVMTVALRNFLAPSLHVPVMVRCWRHSLASALICEELAGACWLDKDRHYTVGLIHDLGRLALLGTYPEDYTALLEEADNTEDPGFDLLDAERDCFDSDHAEIGRLLAEEWQFPAEYIEVTGNHHEPQSGDRLDAAKIVHVACRIADMLGFQAAGPATLVSLDEVKQEFPEFSWDRVKPENDLLLSVAGSINALECSLTA